jgi:hypothetical protein
MRGVEPHRVSFRSIGSSHRLESEATPCGSLLEPQYKVGSLSIVPGLPLTPPLNRGQHRTSSSSRLNSRLSGGAEAWPSTRSAAIPRSSAGTSKYFRHKPRTRRGSTPCASLVYDRISSPGTDRGLFSEKSLPVDVRTIPDRLMDRNDKAIDTDVRQWYTSRSSTPPIAPASAGL